MRPGNPAAKINVDVKMSDGPPLRTQTSIAQRDLHIVPDAGHAMTEPGTIHALIKATRRFAETDR
jgi:hypothetical protein